MYAMRCFAYKGRAHLLTRLLTQVDGSSHDHEHVDWSSASYANASDRHLPTS
jgi:hypothetical protein